jgi:hypothetical protein
MQKSSELLWLLGIVLVALGVAVCSKADLGVSMIAAPHALYGTPTQSRMALREARIE